MVDFVDVFVFFIDFIFWCYITEYISLGFLYNWCFSASSCGDSSNSSVIDVSHVVCSTGSEKSVTNYSISPGGMRYYISSCVVIVDTPFRKVLDRLEKFYNFYKEYGRSGGFDVWKVMEKGDSDYTIIL